MLFLAVTLLAGCARPEREKRPVRERVAEVVEEKKPAGSVRATGGHLSWQDEQGRPLLEVTLSSVEGGVSAASGAEGPMTLREAKCRLFEDGKPTTWLKAPVVVWDDGRLVAAEGADAESVDGRMSAHARKATWTAATRLLEMERPVCRSQEAGRPALTAEGPAARWTGGMLSLPAGVKARTADGGTTMQARQMRWRAATGSLQASGDVEVRRGEIWVRSQQLGADTRVRQVRFTGSPRMEIENVRSMKRIAVGGAALAVGIGLAHAAAPAPQARVVPGQNIVVQASEFDGDLVRLDFVASGNATLTSPRLTMTANQLSVKGEKGGNRIAAAEAVGEVRLRTKTEKGVTVTATGSRGTYRPGDDRATLTGGVRFQFTSPRLAEPGTLVGDRVEMVLSTGKATVFRTTSSPVVVTLKPKKGEGVVDLRAGQVEADTQKDVITATGTPVLKHPQGTLAADKIWFEIDAATNDVRVAHAEGAVRMDAAWKDGQTAEGRSQRAQLLRKENRVLFAGDVKLTQTAPDLEGPRTLSGETVDYNMTTRRVRVVGGSKQVEFHTPVTPRSNPAAPDSKAAAPKPPKDRANADSDR